MGALPPPLGPGTPGLKSIPYSLDPMGCSRLPLPPRQREPVWVAQATAVLRVAGASPRSDDRAMRRQHTGLAPTGILAVSR